MFTFLPEEYKKNALKEYRFRLFMLYLGFTSIFFMLGSAFALPTYSLVKTNKEIATEEHATLVKNQTEDPISLEKEVRALNTKIEIIKKTSEHKSLTSVIERVLTQKGDAITLQTLSLRRGKEKGAITIGGVASSRDALVAFSKRLQGEPSFSGINLPVSSLTKNKDIPFNISIDSSF
jgi:hypothetical protein